MRSNKRIVPVLLIAFTLLLAGCTPEGSRERGGGAGGDPGNHSFTVNMHGGTDPAERIYYQTPSRGQGIERSSSAGAIDPES